MKNFKKIFTILLLFAVIASAVLYFMFFRGNVKEDTYLYIPTNATYQQVLDSLEPKLKSINSFKSLAEKMKYPSLIKRGKYKLEQGESNFSLVRKLRSGNQVEQAIAVNNYSNIYVFAGKLARKIEADSLQVIAGFEQIARDNNYTEIEELKAKIIPNTYNFFWNTSPQDVMKRLIKEYDTFWTKERLQQAQAQHLTDLQAMTLASIVQRESSKADEQPKIAGLYLNRLQKGMKLESDPTVIYALQKQNGFQTIIKRVLRKDLQTVSPYNTYQITGLPPFPICIPSINAIEAVLKPEKHNYIFMCAQPGYTGYHNFAEDFATHDQNAKAYQQWLNSEGIRR